MVKDLRQLAPVRPRAPKGRRPYEPDPLDQRILAMLRDDGRAPLAAIARALHLSHPAVHERLQRLTKAGYILGYHADLDYAKLDDGRNVSPVQKARPSLRGHPGRRPNGLIRTPAVPAARSSTWEWWTRIVTLRPSGTSRSRACFTRWTAMMSSGPS